MSTAPRYSFLPVFVVERPTLDEYILLSLMLHVLIIVLFGDTAGGGSRRGEKIWGALTVSVEGKLPNLGLPSKPLPPSPPPPVKTAPPRPSTALPATPAPAAPPPSPQMETPAEATPAPAPEIPPLMAIEVEKPLGDFVVPKAPPQQALAIPIAPLPVPPPTPPTPRASPPAPTLAIPQPIAVAPIPLPSATPVAIPAPTRIAPLAPTPLPRIAPVVPAPRELATIVPLAVPTLAPIPAMQAEPIPARIEPVSVKPALAAPLPKPPEIAPVQIAPAIAPLPAAAEVASKLATEKAQALPPTPTADAKARDAALTPKNEPLGEPASAPAKAQPVAAKPAPAGVPAGAASATAAEASTAATAAEALTPVPGKTPGLDLDAMRRRAREMNSAGANPRTVFALPLTVPPKPKTKEQQAFDKALKKNDCRDAHEQLGLAAVVPLVLDTFRENGCKW